MLRPLPISPRVSDSLRPTCDSNVRARFARVPDIFLKECPTNSTIAGLSSTWWVAAPTKLHDLAFDLLDQPHLGVQNSERLALTRARAQKLAPLRVKPTMCELRELAADGTHS
jgi:hypothetical protein